MRVLALCIVIAAISFPFSSLFTTFLNNGHQTSAPPTVLEQSAFHVPSPTIIYSPEVRAALRDGLPVVALESTIISHGMPYPANFETAVAVEEEVRQAGGIPATIAILNGVVHIGLTHAEMEGLARKGKEVKKCSRRDIAALVGAGDPTADSLGEGTGATTVAATSYLARLAHPDLRVFVTGGIGGVHRGWESTMDISADLTELGRTDITVVCAGAKSILDIPATLEYLETQGVAVVAYQSDYFPSFFTANSGVKAPYRADSAKEIARMILSNRIMRVQSGMVVGVPISTNDAMNAVHIENAIQQALQEAIGQKLEGKDITPFLLEKVNNLTKGDSLHSNIQLIKQNARIGTQIAKELNNLLSSLQPNPISQPSFRNSDSSSTSFTAETNSPGVTIFGGAVVDLMSISANKVVMGSSNPGKFMQGIGGVGRNIAEGVSRLLASHSTPVHLVSALGNDVNGDMLLSACKSLNISTQYSLRVSTHGTAVYSATLDQNGELVVAVADMDVFTTVTPQFIQSSRISSAIATAPLVMIDGNFPVATIKAIVESAHHNKVPVWFEPTSVAKCTKVVQAEVLHKLTYISPNRLEMLALLKALSSNDVVAGLNVTSVNPEDIEAHIKLVHYFQQHSHIPGVIMKMGANGVIVAAEGKIRHYPAIPLTQPLVSVSGAGDSLAAGTIWSLVAQPTTNANKARPSLHTAIKFGLAAAKMSLESAATVNPLLRSTTLHQIVSTLKPEV